VDLLLPPALGGSRVADPFADETCDPAFLADLLKQCGAQVDVQTEDLPAGGDGGAASFGGGGGGGGLPFEIYQDE